SDDSGYYSSISTDSLHSQDSDDFFYGTTSNTMAVELDNAVCEALNGTYTANIVRSSSPWSDTWIANRFQHPRLDSPTPSITTSEEEAWYNDIATYCNKWDL